MKLPAFPIPLSPHQQFMPRPVSLTVFAILNLAFGVMGLLGIISTVVMLSSPAFAGNPALKVMHDSPAYMTWLKITVPVGVVSSLALMAAGVGLWLVKSWGRVLSIIHAIFSIVMGVAGMVVNYLFLMRPLLESAQRQHGPEAAGAIGGAIGATFGGCFGMIYPIVLLIFLTRPNLVAAFRPAAVPPAVPPV